jgi:hypothetical protein
MDTASELQGYVADCEICGEPVFRDDDKTEAFGGLCHKGCADEVEREMADYEEERR